MAQVTNTGDSLFELGKLYCDRGDFEVAIEKINQAADIFYKEKSFDKYLTCQNLLLRMYSEREDNDKINVTKEKLQDLVLKEGFELSSKTYYTLGVSATFKQQYDL
ncbi:MAG TPA: hypothetical protein VFV50_09630, partial [Bdellovibrionales bacterium]|nr:hypothetical protein [Bdellovibrionales bacterium]